MGLNHDAVGVSATLETAWTSTDCLLYALGVGAGAGDPTGSELEFTTENTRDYPQRVLPTFPLVVGTDVQMEIFRLLGDFNRAMIVHGEQEIDVHRSLPVEGRARVRSTVTGIYDKGSGALVTTETTLEDLDGGDSLATTRSGMFIRGEGGWGGASGPGKPDPAPDRPADHEVTYPTRADQALLYRLNGDRNPLHSNPKFAAKLGFERPILHGLCTFGFTGRALLHTLCASEPERFIAMSGRFSKPVLPGDDLVVTIWDQRDGEAVYQTSTGTGATVLDAGRFRYRA